MAVCVRVYAVVAVVLMVVATVVVVAVVTAVRSVAAAMNVCNGDGGSALSVWGLPPLTQHPSLLKHPTEAATEAPAANTRRCRPPFEARGGRRVGRRSPLCRWRIRMQRRLRSKGAR